MVNRPLGPKGRFQSEAGKEMVNPYMISVDGESLRPLRSRRESMCAMGGRW